MIKRSHLAHFLAVVECGGFTAAARRLNLTQPTVSASISELERQINAPLLIRDRKRIAVTEAGNRLLALARSIERDFRLAETTVGITNRPERILRVGILCSVPNGWLTSLKRHYQGKRPLVFVEGTNADLRRRLQAEQIDAALVIARPQDECLGPAHHEEYGALLPKSHELASRKILRAEDLAEEVMVARRSCEILGETSKFFTSRGIRPHFVMRSNNDERCLSMVRAGFAVTTGPQCLADHGIVASPIEGYDFRRSIILAWSTSVETQLAEAWSKLLVDLSSWISD